MKKSKLIFLLIIFSSFLIGCEKTSETEINNTSSSKLEYIESPYKISGMHSNKDLDKLFILTYDYVGVNYTNEAEEKKLFMEKAKQSFELFKLVEDNADAFVMDAYNYRRNDTTTNPDLHGSPIYLSRNLNYPSEIDPDGQCIRVSKNYFKLNPIETADGSKLEEKIIYDDMTLNLLVPAKYKDMESLITKAHIDRFYYEKVDAANNYNEEYGIDEKLEIPKENLKINIIYVKDGQKYSAYRSDYADDTDNCIEDPIVQIYTSNIHFSYISKMMSPGYFNVYFPYDTCHEDEAYKKILPYIKHCHLEDVIGDVFCAAGLIIE